MQVHLTPHAEELLRDALARDPSRSSEEIIERALEVGRDLGPSPEKVRECLKSIPGVWVPDDWPGAFDDFEPISVEGEPVSEQLIRERR